MGVPSADGSLSPGQNGTPAQAASWSVEVVYRGIFQKRLANRISRGVVLGARKEGKVGTAFARYGDSPRTQRRASQELRRRGDRRGRARVLAGAV